MLLIVLLSFLFPLIATTDYDTAVIIGSPRLACSPHYMTFTFDTNIPFQGRILIGARDYTTCSTDYSSNIDRNASFRIDLRKCAQRVGSSNGSWIYTASVSVSFHPLVITNSDRLFSVECMDTTSSISRPSKEDDVHCEHLVRHASRWDSSTVFRVGDPVVHEWTCNFDRKENIGKYVTVLNSCNAVSERGNKIHLVDENGCIVDSELMGDLVYNQYQVKMYARAKMFRFMTEERLKITCQLHMCRQGPSCGNNIAPPRCAFTREEILKRHEKRNGTSFPDDNLKTNGLLMEETKFEKQLTISSEWVTVHHSDFTNADSLHEKYYIKSIMDPSTSEEENTTPKKHFLMGISYRDPDVKEVKVDKPVRKEPTTSLPENNVHISPVQFTAREISNEVDSIEVPTFVLPVVRNRLASSSGNSIPRLASDERWKSTSQEDSQLDFKRFGELPESISSTQTSTIRVTTVSQTPSTDQTTLPTVRPPPKSPKHRTPAPIITSEVDGEVRTILISATKIRKKVEPVLETPQTTTTTPAPTTKTPEISVEEITSETPFMMPDSPFEIREVKSELRVAEGNNRLSAEFENKKDWRLDDVALNDTEFIRSASEYACANATIVSSERAKCRWTGLEHILLVWSFGSLIVWIILFGVCFYRYSSRQPDWVEYRRREAAQRGEACRVLGNEHPWMHPDAFEEPRSQLSKTHIDMGKF